MQINTSSLTHASGSTMIRIGDTTVICGVRAETLPVTEIPGYRQDSKYGPLADEIGAYDLLVPNMELATGSAPGFLPGVPPTALAQTLSTRLYSLLLGSNLIQVDDLKIWETHEKVHDDVEMAEDENQSPQKTLRAYWTLFIDVTFISYDGNPFDAAWIAVLSALHDTKLPKAWWDADMEMVLCSQQEKDRQKLNLHGFPVALTAVVFAERDQTDQEVGDYWILADPDGPEEKVCGEWICMVVDCSEGSTKIRSLSKHGGRILDKELIRSFRKTAEVRWKEFRTQLTQFCGSKTEKIQDTGRRPWWISNIHKFRDLSFYEALK